MCLFCEKGPFGTMINLADHMTTDHSFEESGKLKADLGVDKSSGEQKAGFHVDKSASGKESYEMFHWFLMVADLGT